MESYRLYKKLPINCIAFTKVDEAVRFGSLYNLILVYQRPVAYITTGQNVPKDIEFPSKDGLVNLILRKGFFQC
jgi:flagellar biosynthesis protein FlhF